MRTCARCSVPIDHRHYRATLCQPCVSAHARAYQLDYYGEKKKPYTSSAPIPCPRCGRDHAAELAAMEAAHAPHAA